jgi:hypothetical protein
VAASPRGRVPPAAGSETIFFTKYYPSQLNSSIPIPARIPNPVADSSNGSLGVGHGIWRTTLGFTNSRIYSCANSSVPFTLNAFLLKPFNNLLYAFYRRWFSTSSTDPFGSRVALSAQLCWSWPSTNVWFPGAFSPTFTRFRPSGTTDTF